MKKAVITILGLQGKLQNYHHQAEYYFENEEEIKEYYNTLVLLIDKYSSDYDYFFRMIVKKKLNGIGTKKNEIFGTFRRGGFSSKIDFTSHFFEEMKIRIDNGQNKLLILIILISILCKLLHILDFENIIKLNTLFYNIITKYSPKLTLNIIIKYLFTYLK